MRPYNGRGRREAQLCEALAFPVTCRWPRMAVHVLQLGATAQTRVCCWRRWRQSAAGQTPGVQPRLYEVCGDGELTAAADARYRRGSSRRKGEGVTRGGGE